MKNILLTIFFLFGLLPDFLIAQERVIIASSSNMNAETNGEYVWAKAFKEALEKSGFEPILYPGSALGRDDARTDLVQLNLLQVNITGDQEVYAYSKIFSGLKYPFLFDNDDHFARLFSNTDFKAQVNKEIKRHNMQLMDVIFLGGMTGLFNTKKNIATFDDLAGLRIRASDSMQLLMMNSWGLSGTQVAWEEVAQALETGIADGYLNPPLVPLMFGHTRQIKYFTNLNLNPSSRYVVVADEWYRALAPDRRKIFDDAILQAGAANRAWASDIRKKEFGMLRKAGITVAEIKSEDRKIFIQRTDAYLAQNKLRDMKSETAKLIEQARGKK